MKERRTMNRQLRRMNGIKTKQAVYNLTQEQIDKLKMDATEKALEDSLTLLLVLPVKVLPVKVLKEHYGFSRKKLENFCSFISDEYEKVPLDKMGLAECKQYMYDTVGVRFEMN